MLSLLKRLLVLNFHTDAYLHTEENSKILNWNERLNIAVDVAHGNVLFMAACFLHCAPLHCP